MKTYEIQISKKDYLLYEKWNMGSIRKAQEALKKAKPAPDLDTFCRIPAFFGKGLKSAKNTQLHLLCIVSNLYGKLKKDCQIPAIDIISPY